MELNLNKQSVTVNEMAFDGNLEQSIESDLILPDYCPDIVKILKCEVDTRIVSAQVNGDKLMIEGLAIAKIYYLSDKMDIHFAEQKIPFSKSSEVRASALNPIIMHSASVDYINCRATSQRRFELRGAVKINVKLLTRKVEDIVSDAHGRGMHLRKETHKSTGIIAYTGRQFTVREQLEVGFGKPPAANVVRVAAVGATGDFKVISGKVIAKGLLKLHVLYRAVSELGGLEVMEYELPVSQIIDADGIDEDCVCEVTFETGSCEVRPKADASGENSLFAVEAQISVNIKAHKTEQVSTVADCYSTEYECTCERKLLGLRELLNVVSVPYTIKETIELPNDVSTVVDMWADIADYSAMCSESGVRLAGKVALCMLAVDSEGAMSYYDRPCDFEYMLPAVEGSENATFEPRLTVGATAYSMLGPDRLDVRAELIIQGCVYSQKKHNVVSAITVNEAAPKKKDTSCGLVLYFAEKGENVWDIAKIYNTSVDAVMDENAIDNATLNDKRMLLIPIIQ